MKLGIYQLRNKIFRQGSTTFYYSSLLFPKNVRTQVTSFYAFVRVADDLVDQVPQDKAGFKKFVSKFSKSWHGQRPSGDPIIDGFISLAREKKFQEEWIVSFLEAMESDLSHRPAKTLAQTKQYMYGSAEVIGLMMAAILDLPIKSREAASVQGRAFQYINFIRDLSEDNQLGRRYLPEVEMKKFGLKSLSAKEASQKPEAFDQFIKAQLEHYRKWQQRAQAGYQYLPWRYLVPIKTAADMYQWTADKIDSQPSRVFREKIKPERWRVLSFGLINLLKYALNLVPTTKKSLS